MILPPRSSRQALAATASVVLFAAALLPTVAAQWDPMATCKTMCDPVVATLDPCGGGASNETLQQDLIFTPTKSLGGCECNSVFYNALSSCLSCIASQGKNEPEIQNQQDWVANCKAYGFDFTPLPVKNSTSTRPDGTDNGGDGSKSGLSTGAIVGIIIGVLAVVALGIAGFLVSQRRKRTGAGIFERPYTSASSGTGGYAPTPTQAEFSNHDSYHNPDYQQDDYYQDDQGQNQYYQSTANMYDQHQQYGNQEYQGYDQSGYDQSGYSNGNNSNNSYAMQSLPITSTANDYVPPPVASPTATAAAAVGAASLAPRPPDTQPQSLRNKSAATWASSSHDNIHGATNDSALYNDKQLFDEGEELEPPRSRERFKTEHDEFRRSLTPPRAVMQSYKDDFVRPSFERDQQSRPSYSGSERGSISGLDMARGFNGSTDRLDSPLARSDSPEIARRRERAAELFSAESKRS